ncbi:MAG: hypothetical protein UT24_C0016G0052 [Candidatus Woesebacteria bacterium GW2011_GWB1_39_12]|uniref:Uncharacterized protein n=1 Tax=Candidatus Woesebacteria bacterium GW2011_GWB1_39_12 TaxID=1618574 RepID=A0A0G0MAG1_9BACT|nr:MAG: hypothetical protein UT24_C0016G0052 [Candidatus Woesebacteria bacterium GW2011_GWB1_39_12]
MKNKEKCKHPKIARHPYGFCNNCGKEISKEKPQLDWEEDLIILGLMNLQNKDWRTYEVKKLIKFVNLLLQKTRRKVVEEIIGKLKRQSYLFGHKWQVPSNKRYTAYCPKCQKVC